MAAVAPFDTHSDLSEGERLGERIAELNAYLTVTQAHFLELLREFDEQRYWEAHGAAYHIERFVSQYRRIEKLGEPAFAEYLHASRKVTYHYDDDGCVVIKARIPAEQGELVIRALERAMDGADVSAHVSAETSGAHIENGPCVSAETSQRIACECCVTTIEETLAWMYRRFDKYRLDGDACRAKWYAGDRMDWDSAMLAAFQQQGGDTLNSRSIRYLT